MEIKEKKLSGSSIEVIFETEWEELKPYYETALLELGKKITIEGFRPGKAPKEIIEKHVKESEILNLAGETFIKDKYTDYVRKSKANVIGNPTIEILKIAKGNPFSFRVKVDVIPEIDLPDYKKIVSQIKKEDIPPVEEKEVEQALRWLRQSRGEFKEIKEPAKKGNFVEIEYSSPQIENNKLFQDAFFLGQGKLVPGLEDNIIGLMAKEEKEIDLDFPENYANKKLAGQKAHFKVKVKKIQEVKLPDLDDDFAKGLGNFEDLEKLKNSIREGIMEEKEIEAKQNLRTKALRMIVKETKIDVPQSLLLLEKKRLMEALKAEAENKLKMSFPEYLKKTGKTEEEIEESLAKSTEDRIKEWLVLREISQREKIKAEPEEIEKEVNKYLAGHPDFEQTKGLDLQQLKDYYKEAIVNEKVFKKLEGYVLNNPNNN